MALTLPRLDDRRWADLVEEGRSLLPLYAPGWTDHNLHDPGITLMELFAWIAEMDLYRLDRVPAAHVRKFLALLGIVPLPPAGAEAVVGPRLKSGGDPLPLPAGLLLDATTAAGERVGYLTTEPVTLVPGALAALQSQAGGEVRDLTAAWRRGEPIAPFGDDPKAGDALYLGFSEPPAAGVPLSLWFEVEGGGAGERRRLLERQVEALCRPSPQGCGCGECAEHTQKETFEAPLVHPSVRLSWEVAVPGGFWEPLDATGEVEDDTRSLTLSGRLTLYLPEPPEALRVGELDAPFPYLRCRIAGGAYDAPPRLLAVILNGVRARQEVPVSTSWVMAPGAQVEGDPPVPGQEERLDLSFDARGAVKSLVTDAEGSPPLTVLFWQAPTATAAGLLTVEGVLLGRGSGRPEQALDLPELLPAGEELTLWSWEDDSLQLWRRRPDLDASGRADADFVVEPRLEDTAAGVPLAEVRFGDGEHGRTPAEAAPVWASYLATRGRLGALPAGAHLTLADGSNRVLLPDFDAAVASLAGIDAPLPSQGGSNGESLDGAALRALEAAETSERAVTLADYERLALATPGTRLARAEARAELHPAFPCYHAPGVITVLVLPFLPAGRPTPSRGLLAAVAAYLNRRRVLGTRVEVAGPVYVEVRVRARVAAFPGVDRAALAARLRDALERFFHPLRGGPEGGGWPFGRAVYGSEVYQVLDETEGTDHVLALELIGADGEPHCDNLCLPAAGLPASGAHEIEVEGGGGAC
ncbi:MAG: putative baseplate assembly protein [Thermoanaerobaculia bacterium]